MPKKVIIVGAGWSGLACAITLAQHGIAVHLLESAPQAGGRARSVQFKSFMKTHSTPITMDNGQHIMLGAYHATLTLLQDIGLKEGDILERQPLRLNLFAPDQPPIIFKTWQLPAPLHLIGGLLTIQGFTIKERWSTITMSLKLAFARYQLKQDISVYALLKQHQQSNKVIQTLWQPLCLATMNTAIEQASAQIFLNILKDSFSKKRSDSDVLFFKHDLSQCFSKPAIEFIEQNNGKISLSTKVSSINFDQSFVRVHTHQRTFEADYVVLATPASVTQTLLAKQDNILKPKNSSLDYHYEPICTIYLQYPSTVKLSHTMIGFFNTLSQWAIDRSVCQQAGIIAIVISGSGQHTQLSHKKLAKTVHQALKKCTPNLPNYLDYQIIIDYRATFSCRVNIQQKRPYNHTQIPMLFIAGDYTNTPYPATLEGAIMSGTHAAQKISLAVTK
ncbi:MAG: hydroxysqualene dehydroxylase HpnE [Gammaproteobacteria bacterium]|nr:hydroxysqualene dehydroxylase HpnE [Gammaproteobacteria bacterium]